jgi:hypothetical protein
MMVAIEMLFVAYFTNNNNEDGANGAIQMLIWIWENKGEIIMKI